MHGDRGETAPTNTSASTAYIQRVVVEAAASRGRRRHAVPPPCSRGVEGRIRRSSLFFPGTAEPRNANGQHNPRAALPGLSLIDVELIDGQLV